MSELTWQEVPSSTSPILIAAFEGWNDAGEAASRSLEYLRIRWGSETFATIDPENFYDFTVTRPTVHRDPTLGRLVKWPTNQFSCAAVPGAPDVILLEGVEPQLRWRTYCDLIVSVAQRLDARLVVTLGALLAEVPHTRLPTVYGTAYEIETVESLGLEPSTYEGPTGIVGILHERCRHAGIPSASLWSAVPSYVASAPSPRAQRALIERVSELLATSIETQDLEREEVAYEEQISELVHEDPETRDYVRHLEEEHDRVDQSTDVDALMHEVENFLREH